MFIWYKQLSFGIKICFYLIAFSEIFGRNVKHNFLGIEVGLKPFFICTLEMVVGHVNSKVLTH